MNIVDPRLIGIYISMEQVVVQPTKCLHRRSSHLVNVSRPLDALLILDGILYLRHMRIDEIIA